MARGKKRRRNGAILIGVLLFGVVFFVRWMEANRCKTCGIDVSHYQGEIDWEKVAGEDIGFVFIKASEGTDLADTLFKRHWEGAGEAGILRGAYHFFRPGRDAEAQARQFLAVTEGLEAELPPVLDVEVRDKQSAAVVRAGVREWMEVVEEAVGRKPILYTMPKFADSYLGEDLGGYPLWVVDLRSGMPRMPKAWDGWVFRQYSHTGRLKGIKGDVDLDCFNGDLEELLRFSGSR